MAGEAMTSGTPEFVDPVRLNPLAPLPPPIGCDPVATVEIDHPRLGRCRISQRDYVAAEHGPVVGQGDAS
jgi:hypothetical protein